MLRRGFYFDRKALAKQLGSTITNATVPNMTSANADVTPKLGSLRTTMASTSS